jgi:hypothetical protein
MALGREVGIAGGAARTIDLNRVRRTAAEQKAVVHVSSEPEQLASISAIHSRGSGQGAIGVASYSGSARFCATACAGAVMR